MASAVILYSPSFKALTSCATVAGSSALGAVVAVAGVVAGAAAEFAAGVACELVSPVVDAGAVGCVVVGFVEEVVVFATTGVSSAANAKLS